MAYIVCLIFLYNFSVYNAVISLKRPVDVPGQTYGYNLSGHICLEGEWGETLGGGGSNENTLSCFFIIFLNLILFIFLKIHVLTCKLNFHNCENT